MKLTRVILFTSLILFFNTAAHPRPTEKNFYKGLYATGTACGIGTALLVDYLFKNTKDSTPTTIIKKTVSTATGFAAGWYFYKIFEQELLRKWSLFTLTLPKNCFGVRIIEGIFDSYQMPQNLAKRFNIKDPNHTRSIDPGESHCLVEKRQYESAPGVKKIAIHYKLYLPTSSSQKALEKGKRVPAIVLCPHSEGVMPGLLNHASWLAKQGVACIVIDHFKERNIVKTASNQFLMSMEEAIIDAYLARKQLMTRYSAYIDPEKIGITGFSRGADAATLSQQKYYYSNLSHDGKPFDLCYCHYPSIISQPANIKEEVAAKPYLVMIGTSDNCTPVKNTNNFVKRLKDAGLPVQKKLYLNGFHAFDETLILRLTPAFFRPFAPIINASHGKIPGIAPIINNLASCSVMAAGKTHFMRYSKGFLPLKDGGQNTENQNPQPYNKLAAHCLENNATNLIWPGYNPGVHRASLHDIQDFLREHGFLT